MAGADLLANGAKAWRGGRAGPVAAEARAGTADAVARLFEILNAGTPVAAAVDAAGVLLAAGRDREAGLLAVDRAAVVMKLRELSIDPRTPPATAVEAARLLLAATGRSAYRRTN